MGATPSQTLCQVAVALIPVLMFGGALTGRGEAKPQSAIKKNRCRRTRVLIRATAAVIIFVIGVATTGEVFAIQGALVPRLSALKLRWVVGTLMLGAFAVGLAGAIPWFRSLVPIEDQGRRYLVFIAAALAAIVAAFFITRSVNLGGLIVRSP